MTAYITAQDLYNGLELSEVSAPSLQCYIDQRQSQLHILHRLRLGVQITGKRCEGLDKEHNHPYRLRYRVGVLVSVPIRLLHFVCQGAGARISAPDAGRGGAL